MILSRIGLAPPLPLPLFCPRVLILSSLSFHLILLQGSRAFFLLLTPTPTLLYLTFKTLFLSPDRLYTPRLRLLFSFLPSGLRQKDHLPLSSSPHPILPFWYGTRLCQAYTRPQQCVPDQSLLVSTTSSVIICNGNSDLNTPQQGGRRRIDFWNYRIWTKLRTAPERRSPGFLCACARVIMTASGDCLC
ncbi:hypothetical protein BJY52DRAFT_482544 [Lactarius psammicola]|nr:hypothetical protein BJY52DRAFT_482544 [Lactarius psammicola]